MSRSSLVLLLALATAACDPVPWTEDGISPYAGRAQIHNMQVHTAGVSSNSTRWPNPGGDGHRAVGIVENYRAGPEAQAAEP